MSSQRSGRRCAAPIRCFARPTRGCPRRSGAEVRAWSYGTRDQVTIAQSGPALILISHPKTVDQFPAELGDWGPALGGEERPEIHVYDVNLEPGSMILLAQSDWPHRVAAQSLAVAAAAPNVTLASQYLGQLAGSAELSALLVSFSSTIPELRDDAEPLPAAGPRATTQIQRKLPPRSASSRPRANASSAAAARMSKRLHRRRNR